MAVSKFDNLFVIEAPNASELVATLSNKAIREFARIAKFYSARTALKLNVSDKETLVHKSFRHRTDLPIIKRTMASQLAKDGLETILAELRRTNTTFIAAPRDNISIQKSIALGAEILDVSVSNIVEWPLIEEVASSKMPTIISLNGCALHDLDNIVALFGGRSTEICLKYNPPPIVRGEYHLQLNQIDFLRSRYSTARVGLSLDWGCAWREPMLVAHAKGASLFERRIDGSVNKTATHNGDNFSDQLSEWFKTLQIAENICGSAGAQWLSHIQYGKEHLSDPVRGVYARHDLEVGQTLSDENVYLAIPLQKGQISYQEFMPGTKILSPISGDDPILFGNIDGPYREGSNLSMEIERRGEDTKPTEASRGIFRIV